MSARSLFCIGWGLIVLAIFIAAGLPLALGLAGVGFVFLASVEAVR